MYPHERSLVTKLAGKPFALIGVNSDKNVDIPKKLVEKGTVTWRSFQNGQRGSAISDAFGVQGWPSVYLIDAEGKVRYINPQRVQGDGMKALDDAIAELLGEIGVDFPADE